MRPHLTDLKPACHVSTWILRVGFLVRAVTTSPIIARIFVGTWKSLSLAISYVAIATKPAIIGKHGNDIWSKNIR